ncbi:hypothetical protein ScPMuIL_011410 [Solemya velum]
MSCNNAIQIHELPPTSAANYFHSLRTYHQVQQWVGNELNPLDYGWKEAKNKFIPVKTSLPAAPSDLLTVVRCNCKKGCDTKRCTYGASADCTNTWVNPYCREISAYSRFSGNLNYVEGKRRSHTYCHC